MSMNDRIDLTARVILDACQDRRDRFPAMEPVSVQAAREYAQALVEAGLITPAPLREEWAAAWEGHGATRIGSAQESPEDIEGVPPGGWVVHRYVSDWLPVDSDEGDGSDDR